ncbi:tetratricopeptide repeat protein 31 isoform X2 [Pezoporus flaviventris]|uniref:tetratricopeptide repeat protein 31 isoform X2 n=1 Tax=Pezoporus flaviventris TaxID=889875 RepID=UPI002AB0F2B2|nr:tetratricopeptide repeat protein 31 isoform X2 [Pezoporus flaviventris]
MAAGQPRQAPCPTSGPPSAPLPVLRQRRGAMREAGGERSPGLGPSGRGAAPAACPWGCALGPGGWSGAPFCPFHCPPERRALPADLSAMGDGTGAWDALGRGPGFWYCPGRLEASSDEEEDEEEDEGLQWSWSWPWPGAVPTVVPVAVPSADGDPGSTFCGLRKAFLVQDPLRPPPSALEEKLPWLPAPQDLRPTAEEAERNAQELVAEEERVKRKAEKKKLKKKKQKERKKREKLGQESQAKQKAESTPPSPSSAAGARHPQGGDAEEEEGAWLDPSPGDSAATPGEEGGDGEARPEEMELDLGLCPPRPCPQEELDLSCTFVFKARQKAGVRLPAPGREKPPRTDPERGRIAPGKAPAPLDTSAMQQSLVLAGQGNAAALRGRYPEAVRAFTAALQLNPREHRLLGNRSYCYEKLQRYEEALGDAERALGLQPRWAKGLFRKGKALRGLQGPVQVVVAQAQHLSVSQRYAEAAQTFEELLRLHRTGTGTGTDTDAAAQLEACRALLQQSSLGGVPTSPPSPMSPLSPLEAAEPALPLRSGSSHHKAMGMSGFITIGSSRIQAQCQPPRGCFPLWVGNVTPRISRSVLQHCFGQFGEIQSIRMLPERRCAFLNYTCKEAAEAAFEAMRDSPVEGTLLALQLKHPSHATPRPRWYPQPCLGEPL